MKQKYRYINVVTAWCMALCVGAAIADPVSDVHKPQAEHANQVEFFDLVTAGQKKQAFDTAFELGDELFETVFNVLDGVGANVGNGNRFTRVPRADLVGQGQWATHFPSRASGPNAQSCNSCHNLPFDDGAGMASSNVHRDPQHSAQMNFFITRNTPHLFATGALQRLAEEMTGGMHRIRLKAENLACQRRARVNSRLLVKGISYGVITAIPTNDGGRCRVRFDTSRVTGVDADLIVKPFQWKGTDKTVRIFNRGASHNELGMQAVEVVGEGMDGDFDGVVNEMTIGDQTALAIYIAAQPRPVTTLELSDLGLIPALQQRQIAAIDRGNSVFKQIGCDGCHRSSLPLRDPIFSEPSRSAAYRERVFPSGIIPTNVFVDPDFAVTFDLTRDQPDNVITLANGDIVRLGSFKTNSRGWAIIELYSDLKRHDMGPELAENIDEGGTGASVWITKELWGVGSTAPYLHDGRASTLTEAILLHGGEAAYTRRKFKSLSVSRQKDLIKFLDSLVLFKVEE